MKNLRMKLHKFRQRGVIFLALVMVLVIAGSAFTLGALNNRQTTELAREREVQYQMEQAKAALLAYAANHAELWSNARGPGFFPCPDTDDPDADPDGTPNYTGTLSLQECIASDFPLIGRLPQMEEIGTTTFRFNDAYADVDRQFWYVVSPRYLYSSTSSNRRAYKRVYVDDDTAFSYASDYWLTLDDDDNPQYVALIIAPGEELDTQDRSTGQTDYSNYLDGQNGGAGFNFYTSYSANPELFNDKILGITFEGWMEYVLPKVAREVKVRLDSYYEQSALIPKRYPPDSGDPTATSCSGTTFSNMFDGDSYGSTAVWLRDNSTGNNGERWSCLYSMHWNRGGSPYTTGDLKFYGCPGLTFTMEYGEEPVRAGEDCYD